jgi:hypothetical protein
MLLLLLFQLMEDNSDVGIVPRSSSRPTPVSVVSDGRLKWTFAVVVVMAIVTIGIIAVAQVGVPKSFKYTSWLIGRVTDTFSFRQGTFSILSECLILPHCAVFVPWIFSGNSGIAGVFDRFSGTFYAGKYGNTITN